MANMETECLNIKCSNKVKDGTKWCSMECKKQFLLDNYSPDATIRAMKEQQEDFKERQKKVLAEIKASGLSFSEFIRKFETYQSIMNSGMSPEIVNELNWLLNDLKKDFKDDSN